MLRNIIANKDLTRLIEIRKTIEYLEVYHYRLNLEKHAYDQALASLEDEARHIELLLNTIHFMKNGGDV